MRLNPKRPPGRSTRKALAFASEIARLHVDGYSCEAIRQALADAGVTVSRATVIREVSRISKDGPPHFAAGQPAPAAGTVASRAATTPVLPPSSGWRSGKDIAAAWIQGRITNPLLQSRITDESSGH